jgi:formyltetrahydrofolate deformylase
MPRARLLVDCPDRPGLVAAIAGFLAARRANIVEADQHSTEGGDGQFLLRTIFDVDGDLDALREAFRAEVGEPLGLEWRIVDPARPKRVAILASREPHCLLDLLWRHERGELDCEVAAVVSNHPDHRAQVEALGLDYHHVQATPANREEAEGRILELVAGCDLVVLARYMQILTPDFLARVGAPVLNIHHSFLPAFVGAEPYRRAFERGVKVIGATAHYVTEELDAGPIIEQDVVRVSHRATVEDLTRMGADVERLVLARAVRWHLEDRILVAGHRTVVF